MGVPQDGLSRLNVSKLKPTGPPIPRGKLVFQPRAGSPPTTDALVRPAITLYTTCQTGILLFCCCHALHAAASTCCLGSAGELVTPMVPENVSWSTLNRHLHLHCHLQAAGGITEAEPMNSGGSIALTQDTSKTGGSMSSAPAVSHPSAIDSLSTAATIAASGPMHLNNNIDSATPSPEGLPTISEHLQVCLLNAFKQNLFFACTRQINYTALCKQTVGGNNILQMLRCLLKLVVSSSAVEALLDATCAVSV